MTNDLDLLGQFTRDHSQDAFTALVNRHVNLVYSAAFRQVRSPQLAEEVAQSVFTDLARNAVKLKPDTILTAWLYQVTRRTAIDVVRRESRRQLREQIAVEMNAMNATASGGGNSWRCRVCGSTSCSRLAGICVSF
jgi:DNA-directed RNA polymerase specialized sigma24 family protein